MKCKVSKSATASEGPLFQITLTLGEANDLIEGLPVAAGNLLDALDKTVRDWADLQNSFWDAVEGAVSEESNV